MAGRASGRLERCEQVRRRLALAMNRFAVGEFIRSRPCAIMRTKSPSCFTPVSAISHSAGRGRSDGVAWPNSKQRQTVG